MPEAVVVAALVKSAADGHYFLGSWSNPGCKLCGVKGVLLRLRLSCTKDPKLLLILLLRLLGCTKQAKLLLVLLLRLLCGAKDAWLALLLTKPAPCQILNKVGPCKDAKLKIQVRVE